MGRDSVRAVINLGRETKPREAFQYAHVHNNTVLVDRRTKWGNPFRLTYLLSGAPHAVQR